MDSRTWYAASQEHLRYDAHALYVYALGLRLDGVNAAVLRDKVKRTKGYFADAAYQSVLHLLYANGKRLSGGAAVYSATGSGRFLTSTYHWDSFSSNWYGASKDHGVPSSGYLEVDTTWIEDATLEGFGALEVEQVNGGTLHVTGGSAIVYNTVEDGWALVGYGGSAEWDAGGYGRMLYKMGPTDTNLRTAEVGSKDHVYWSGGNTTLYWSQARKMPDSHGVCNMGGPLLPTMDPCVRNICSVDPYCCQYDWNPVCIDEVWSVCSRSCADYTCSAPVWDPGSWTGGDAQNSNNCYNYATNHRTDDYAHPGYASGETCPIAGYPTCWRDNAVRYAVNDGLIPIGRDQSCPEGRSKIALRLGPMPDDTPPDQWAWDSLAPARPGRNLESQAEYACAQKC